MKSNLAQLEAWWRRRSLLEIMLAAFALRAALAVAVSCCADGPQSFHLEDTPGYVRLAESLLVDGSFSSDAGPEILRTPGYPVLLLPGVAAGSVEAVTIALQIVLSCATVFLVYRLALAILANQNLAKLAAALYATEMLSLLFCFKVMSETLFTFLIVLFLLAMVRYLGSDRWPGLLLGAAALGAAILVRPVAYYLPLAMGCALPMRAIFATGQRRMAMLQAVVFVGIAWAPAWAWQLRNQAVAGYSGYAAIQDVNLYFYNAASVLAAQRGISVGQQNLDMGGCDLQRYLELHPEQDAWSAVDRYRYMRRQGLAVLCQNLGTYAVIHINGIAPLMLGGGVSECIQLLGLDSSSQDAADRQFKGIVAYAWNLFVNHFGLFSCNVALSCMVVLYLGTATLGLISRQMPRCLPTLFLLCVGAYFVALSAGPSGRPRYRHPLMPIACVFAAPGLAMLFKRRTKDAASQVQSAPDAIGVPLAA